MHFHADACLHNATCKTQRMHRWPIGLVYWHCPLIVCQETNVHNLYVFIKMAAALVQLQCLKIPCLSHSKGLPKRSTQLWIEFARKGFWTIFGDCWELTVYALDTTGCPFDYRYRTIAKAVAKIDKSVCWNLLCPDVSYWSYL